MRFSSRTHLQNNRSTFPKAVKFGLNALFPPTPADLELEFQRTTNNQASCMVEGESLNHSGVAVNWKMEIPLGEGEYFGSIWLWDGQNKSVPATTFTYSERGYPTVRDIFHGLDMYKDLLGVRLACRNGQWHLVEFDGIQIPQ